MSKQKKRHQFQRRRQQATKAGQDMPPVDRRALERSMFDLGKILNEQKFESIDEANAFIQNMLASGGLPQSPNRTPLEEAQDLMYQAWDASGAQRVRLARQALSISEDCADAYVLLAEETAHSPEEAQQFYEQGVKAGERALGPQAFEEDAGHFWGILATRPYMRARAGLAGCLFTMGKREEAVAHYQDLLRLNPHDNQGIRYFLANLLLEIGDEEGLTALLDLYGDEASAAWMYTRALALFRQKGPNEAATAQLEDAISQNPFVPSYLLGKKQLPKRLPDYMGFGDENEAIHYAVDAIALWRRDLDAMAWLEGTVASNPAG